MTASEIFDIWRQISVQLINVNKFKIVKAIAMKYQLLMYMLVLI